MKTTLSLLALSLLLAAPGHARPDRRIVEQALDDIQSARNSLNRAEDGLLQLLQGDAAVTCEYFTTGSWKGKFVGTGADEKAARKALVADCFAKYPGPASTVCPNLEGSTAVDCR